NDNGKKQTGMKAPPRAKSNVAPVSFPFEATTLTPSLRSVSFLYEATRYKRSSSAKRLLV
ncbi:MAG TPA: hypothetical protein VL171_03485, partial [Verrucomicrobiae bacterium]|nr:hypothetical protein [Verrucomicrobiae bacterium]